MCLHVKAHVLHVLASPHPASQARHAKVYWTFHWSANGLITGVKLSKTLGVI